MSGSRKEECHNAIRILGGAVPVHGSIDVIMSQIYSHSGVPRELLKQRRSITADDGEVKHYTIDYDPRLVVNMPFAGQEANQSPSVNSAGWIRKHPHYFKELMSKHPEVFSEENRYRIERQRAPYCDEVFARAFPEFRPFVGERLVHHHIGEDGQAVALPQSLHVGYGVVHIDEKACGITFNGRLFSAWVDREAKKGSVFKWSNASYYQATIDEYRRKKLGAKKPRFTRWKDKVTKLAKDHPVAVKWVVRVGAAAVVVALAYKTGKFLSLPNDDLDLPSAIADIPSGMEKVSPFAEALQKFKEGLLDVKGVLNAAEGVQEESGKSFLNYLQLMWNFHRDSAAKEILDGVRRQ